MGELSIIGLLFQISQIGLFSLVDYVILSV